MRLHYYQSVSNFGDDLNRWLWAEIFGGTLPVRANLRLVGIGTILDDEIPCDRRIVVLGSGVGYKKLPPPAVVAQWRILGVRGPLTACALGLPPSKVITDSALLLRTLGRGQPISSCQRNGGLVFMPHHRSDDIGVWPDVCRRAGVRYLSPYGDSRETLEILKHARLVLAEAMHGAIVADALRVPWIPVVTSCDISSFKWVDWTSSMKLEYKPFYIPTHNLRGCWEKFVLKLLRQGTFEASSCLDAQMESFQNRVWRFSGIGGKILDGLRLRACGKRHMRWIAKIEGHSSFRQQEERLMENAADTLRAASRQPGNLSAEALMIRKLDELQSAVGSLSSGAV